MASETPKKVVDEISKCFLCSSPFAAQERVFIFGNSIHIFVEIMRSSLDFDISCYANSKLFKAVCYKRLLKFERATKKVLERKREILESFQGRPRKVFNLGRPKMFVQNLPLLFLLLAIIRDSSLVQNEVDKPTRLLQFVAFVHLPFSFRSLDLFCSFTLVYEGHFVLCYKTKIELLDRVKANFERS